MEMPSKQTSVTVLSTTIIWVSNTSEPICIRQKTAARREPKERKENCLRLWQQSIKYTVSHSKEKELIPQTYSLCC